MINSYDAVDWQSFSQKKDIEAIAKNTRGRNAFQLSATIEICLVVLSIAFSRVTFAWSSIAIWILGGISACPVIYILVKMARDWYTRKKTETDILNAREMIDLFDNETCYCVLMAESYSRKLGECEKDNIYNFYYIETCFYLNKAIYNLSLMENNIENVFSKDADVIYRKKTISLTRLRNLTSIISDIISLVDDYSSSIRNIDDEKNYAKVNDKYKVAFNRFMEQVDSHFQPKKNLH